MISSFSSTKLKRMRKKNEILGTVPFMKRLTQIQINLYVLYELHPGRFIKRNSK
jgi:hypothetical protein